jgi:transcription termination factor NusB
LVERLEFAERVGKMHMRGRDKRLIAEELGVRQLDVTRAIQDWQTLLRTQATSAGDIKDRVMTVLWETDEHWRDILDEAWDLNNEAKNQSALAAQNNALKLIAQINKDRVQVFTQAGLNQDTELVEELNETQRKHELIIQLLKEIKEEHPEVSAIISRRLSQMGDEVEAVEVVDQRREIASVQ